MDDTRPKGWAEVTARLERSEITQVQACAILKINRNKLNALLNKDNPNRRDRRSEAARKIGLANKKTELALERVFSDQELCLIIREKGRCEVCPIGCRGRECCGGLAVALARRVPLKKETKNNDLRPYDRQRHKEGDENPV